LRIIYFDEVKPNPDSFGGYLLAGLSVSETSMRSTLMRVNEVKRSYFSDLGLDDGEEIHTKFIYHGKSGYKGKDLELRLNLIADLLRLLEADDVRLVYSWTNVEKLYDPQNALDYCFTHFCERAHNCVDRDGTGLLIGDLDDDSRNHLWRKFGDFRKAGTPWTFGQKLPRFVDTVHFVDSRVCELVQLADVYAFHLSGSGGHRKGYAAKRLSELTHDINLFPSSYKVWPK